MVTEAMRTSCRRRAQVCLGQLSLVMSPVKLRIDRSGSA
jgi:hypothetical protein